MRSREADAGGRLLPEVVAVATRPVTLADILDGHAVLDIACLDRIYLNGYVPGLQTSGQVVGFLHHRGFPISSPAALGKVGNAFRAAMARYAEANSIPWIRFGKGDRKVEVIRPYLEAAEREGRPRVVAIGVAQESQWAWDATQKNKPGGAPWFSYYRADRRVTCYYAYIWDDRMGPGFIKVCAYAPYPVKVWLNGHAAVRQMAAAAGLDVAPLANGFASCADPAALQDLCDQLAARHLRMFFERWMARLPLPLGNADRAAGYWWELAMRQVETSRTIVLDDPRRARTVFEQLLAGNMHLGRPEHVEVVFGRKVTSATPGVFSTRLLNRPDQVTVNFSFRHSRIKIYLKEDRALRVETVCNDPADLGCRRGLDNLRELQARARDCNARLMQAIRVGQGSGCLASPAFERIAQPTLTEDGRRAPALRFGDPRVQALAGSLAVLGFAVTGITNKSLRAWMTGLLGQPYTMTKASYDLARLSRNGLITRRPHANTYDLTSDGQLFAVFYPKVHDQVLYPLMAGQVITTPAEVRRALHVIDRHIASLTAAAALRRAA
jgi:hypothetical protein